VRSWLTSEFGHDRASMATKVSTTSNVDAIRLRKPHLLAVYRGSRDYANAETLGFRNKITEEALAHLCQLTTASRLLFNQCFIRLKEANRLESAFVSGGLSGSRQGTNTAKYIAAAAQEPERVAKAVMQFLANARANFALTQGGLAKYESPQRLLRNLISKPNCYIWACQYHVLNKNAAIYAATAENMEMPKWHHWRRTTAMEE
jgi:hypothetical protein